MNLRTLDDEPRQPRPIRAGIKQQAPGANVRLLGHSLSRKRAQRLYEYFLEDMSRVRLSRGILAAIRRAIGEGS